MAGAGPKVDQSGAQDRPVPVNSGARPEEPPGGHITQLLLPLEDPVGVAAPAVDALLPPRPAPPPLPPPDVPDPRVPVVEPVLVPALPPVVPVVPVADVVDAVVVEEVVVEVVVVEVVVVPTVGVGLVSDEFCTLGNATAPPDPG